MRILPGLLMTFLLLALVSCSAKKTAHSEPPPVMAISHSDFIQEGVASWYGDDFHGKTTANGEIYDMHKLTAAHPTLPFHTIVEVENLENGKKVLVRINDRGPFLKNRVIDLSLRAAQRLSMSENGTATVQIRAVRWHGAPKPDDVVPAGSGSAECCVQFGAFALRENADDLRVTLEEIFPALRLQIIVEDDMFKVLSEKFPDESRCQEIVAKLADYHLQGFLRRP